MAFSGFGLTESGAPTGAIEPYVPCADGGATCVLDEEPVGGVLGERSSREGVITRIGLWGTVAGQIQLGILDDDAAGLRVRELTPPISIQPGYNAIPVRLRTYAYDQLLVTDARIVGYLASDELEGRYVAPPFIVGAVSPWFGDVGRPVASVLVEGDADRDGVPDAADRCDTASGDAPCAAEVVLGADNETPGPVLAGRTAVHRFQVNHRAGGPVDQATLRVTASAGRISWVPAGCSIATATVATCTVSKGAAAMPVFARTRSFTVRVVTPSDGGVLTTTAAYENPLTEGAPVPMTQPVASATATTAAIGPRTLRPRIGRFRLAAGRLSFDARCPGAGVLASCMLQTRVTTGTRTVLGSVRRRIASDRMRRVTVRLSRRAREMLGRKRIRATVHVTRLQIGTQSSTTRATITLRAAKGR